MNRLQQYKNFLILAVTCALLSYLTDGTFFSPRNLTNLSRQVAINGILAVGMTYVILLGGIDLSIGSVVALSGVVAGLTQVSLGWAEWQGSAVWFGALASVLIAIAVGTMAGLTNAFLITRFRIAPFIITLGMMVIARGLALIFAKGAAIAPLGDAFNSLGQSYVGPMPSVILLGGIGLSAIILGVRAKAPWGSLAMWGILSGISSWACYSYRGLPIPVIIFGLFAFLGAAILTKTRLGRYVLAIGGNPDAAWLAGVPNRPITFWIYVVLGSLAGLSGAIQAARLNGALPTAGELFELDAIAAVVIGGTSLLGGVGSISGTIFGAFFIGSLNNGMSLMDVTEFYQKVIKGVIIILAVGLDRRQNSRS